MRYSIFITGGGSGIGRAIGQLFAARGWFAGLTDIDERALAEAVSSPGPFVLDVVIDADRPAPSQGRNEGLKAAQAARREAEAAMSFPVVGA